MALPKYRFSGEPLAVARGVGNHPNSVPAMPGANIGSWNAMPLCIKPERGQVSKNSPKPSAWLLSWASKQVCDVLHDDVAGSNFANKAGDFRPESASGSFHPSLLSGAGDILAREASANNVDCSDILALQLSHVFMDGNARPVLGKDAPWEWLDLAERHGLEAASALKAQREAADAREEIEDAQGLHC